MTASGVDVITDNSAVWEMIPLGAASNESEDIQEMELVSNLVDNVTVRLTRYIRGTRETLPDCETPAVGDLYYRLGGLKTDNTNLVGFLGY